MTANEPRPKKQAQRKYCPDPWPAVDPVRPAVSRTTAAAGARHTSGGFATGQTTGDIGK